MSSSDQGDTHCIVERPRYRCLSLAIEPLGEPQRESMSQRICTYLSKSTLVICHTLHDVCMTHTHWYRSSNVESFGYEWTITHTQSVKASGIQGARARAFMRATTICCERYSMASERADTLRVAVDQLSYIDFYIDHTMCDTYIYIDPRNGSRDERWANVITQT